MMWDKTIKALADEFPFTDGASCATNHNALKTTVTATSLSGGRTRLLLVAIDCNGSQTIWNDTILLFKWP